MTRCRRMPDMVVLAGLAGWTTIPDARDHEVVRLALTRARQRQDPDAGGSRANYREVGRIEGRWLEEIL